MRRLIVALALFSTASLAAHAQPNGDAARGQALFEDRCSSCHVAEGGGQGPSLIGVVGRKAASAPGVSYSKALRASALTWTRQTLDTFLADPATRVPGTAMPIATSSAQDRADLIAFLASPANRP